MNGHDSEDPNRSTNKDTDNDLVPEWQQLLNDTPLSDDPPNADSVPHEDDWIPTGSASTDAALDGTYVCDNCGEEIVIPLDIAAGRDQQYVEDCPVCCSPSVIHVHFDNSDHADVWAEPEQDRY